MFFIWLCEKAQDIKSNVIKDITIWTRKVQNSLLRHVAGNVGRYQTSVSDTLQHYKWRMKNTVNFKTINKECKTLRELVISEWT